MNTTIFYPSGTTISLPLRSPSPHREPFLAVHIDDVFAVMGIIDAPSHRKFKISGHKAVGGDSIVFDPRAIIIGFPEGTEKPIIALNRQIVLRYSPHHFADDETLPPEDQYDPRRYAPFPPEIKEWLAENPEWNHVEKLMEISNRIKQGDLN